MITYTFHGDNDYTHDRPGAPVFASDNVESLPRSVMYNRVAADADVNSTASIDLISEMDSLARDDAALSGIFSANQQLARGIVDFLYQTTRSYKSVIAVEVGQAGSRLYRTDRVMEGVRPNDVLVAVRSALACDFFPSFHAKAQASGGCSRVLSGPAGRNHANVADADVAAMVFDWLRCRETMKKGGDLSIRVFHPAQAHGARQTQWPQE